MSSVRYDSLNNVEEQAEIIASAVFVNIFVLSAYYYVWVLTRSDPFRPA